MRYILDTCVLIWALEGRESKLGNFKEIILDDKNVIFVSIASYWEIVIKESIGRIKIDHNISDAIIESGFMWLGIKTDHIDYIKKLPLIHNDPFDRLLIAQSKTENIKLLTSDSKILEYYKI
jgi:PIN domain nuclease of toxin-antitoxin system